MTGSRALVLRYGAVYAAFFLALGILLPYWPLWLEYKGLTVVQVGTFLALASWLRVFVSPAIAWTAGRWGRRRDWLAALTAIALVGALGMQAASGLTTLFIANALIQVTLASALVLLEQNALAVMKTQGLHYGRARLWGSASFILANLGVGWVIANQGAAPILYLIIACLLCSLAATRLMRVAGQGASLGTSTEDHSLSDAFTRKGLWLLCGVMLAAGLLQASHAAFYAFSALHWTALGLDGEVVGLLWSLGVVSEIVLFAVMRGNLASLPPFMLLALSGAAGLLRWWATSLAVDPWAIAGCQVLHAVTYGCAHLGFLAYLSRHVPDRHGALVQALFGSLYGGLLMGLATFLATAFAGEALGDTFVVMMAFSAGGLLLASGLWFSQRVRQ